MITRIKSNLALVLLLLLLTVQLFIPMRAATSATKPELGIEEAEVKRIKAESTLTQHQVETTRTLHAERPSKVSNTHLRHLEQEEAASPDEELATCTLRSKQKRHLYNEETSEWKIDDSSLAALEYNLQLIVNCAAPGDVIFFDTSKPIKPAGTVMITKNVTLSAQPTGQLVQDGVIRKTKLKVNFTCPDSEDLFIITNSAVTIANIGFTNCNSSGHVVVLDPACNKSKSKNWISFLHVDFTGHVTTGNRRILSVENNCTQLYMEDVIFEENRCESSECAQLASRNVLHDIRLVRNERNLSTNTVAIFKLPHHSKTSAEGVYGVSNQIRLFHAANSTFNLSNSYFEGNQENPCPTDAYLCGHGSILFSTYSSVSVVGSDFLGNNAAFSGGALYLQFSENSRIFNSTFSRNIAGKNGGAIFLESLRSSLVSAATILSYSSTKDEAGDLDGAESNHILNSTFSNNIAEHKGGAIYLIGGEDNQIVSSTFLNNTAKDGGAIAFVGEDRNQIFHSTFANNAAIDKGGALYIVGGENNQFINSSLSKNDAKENGGAIRLFLSHNYQILKSTLLNNSAIYGGAIASRSCRNEQILNSTLLNNFAFAGGAMHSNTDENLQISGSIYSNNIATDDGGAIYLANTKKSNISFSTLSSNNANRGGALYLYYVNSNQVSSSTFSSNTAEDDGGAVYVNGAGNYQISGSTVFNNSASGGGGIYLNGATNAQVSNSTFSGNIAEDDGGAVYLYRGESNQILNSTFSGNMAEDDGGGIYMKSAKNTRISNSTFANNIVKDHGGAIHLHGDSSQILNSTLLGNSAGSGGAIYVDNADHSKISTTTLLDNRASCGGAIILFYAVNTHIFKSSFSNNTARNDGGAMFALNSTQTTISRTDFASNMAGRSCGAMCVSNRSQIVVDHASILSNSAVGRGGAVGVVQGSSFLCRSCIVTNNQAYAGGGLCIVANSTYPTIAELQDSTFESNTALSYGGAIDFFRPVERTEACKKSRTTCSRLVLLGASMANNSASTFGATIVATEKEDVLVLCDSTKMQKADSLKHSQLEDLTILDPGNLCNTWTWNNAANKSSTKNVAFYGQKLSFSSNSSNDVKLTGSVESGFKLANIRKGYEFPDIFVKVVDPYDNSPAPTNPNSVEVIMESFDGLLDRLLSADVTEGEGNFSKDRIISLADPRNYSLQLSSTNVLLQAAKITVHVRACRVGEELTQATKLCEECDKNSYNFDPTELSNCTSCPDHADCGGIYILPRDHYWHKHPCHSSIQKCLNDEACSYENRSSHLMEFTQNFADCNMTTPTLFEYENVLCKDGYEGPLCGSCQHSYGLSSGFKCLSCPSAASSVFTLISGIIYLAIAAALTISGSLPPDTETRYPKVLGRVLALTHRNLDVRIEESSLEAAESGSEIQLQARTRVIRTVDSTPLKNKCAETGVRTTEIIKILLNFLQQTSIAASINVEWTTAMIETFEVSEYAGALTDATASKPIDCLFDSNTKGQKSLSRLLTAVFVPLAVMFVYGMLWTIIALKNKRGLKYFWKRTFLSIVVILYISYLGLTKTAIRTFYCVEIDVAEDPFSKSVSKFWAVDTSIQCFEKEHWLLVAIGLMVLTTVTISFPLTLALLLFRNKTESNSRGAWVLHTTSFLYRAFKDKFVFWECVVMCRKALLSIVLVFSYPLGGQLQGTLAAMALVWFMYIQISCMPYQEKFHRLNYLESVSLLVSSLTLLLGQFFESSKSSDSTKQGISFVIVTFNVGFALFLFVALIKSVTAQFRAILKLEGQDVNDDTPWWAVILTFITSRLMGLINIGKAI